MQSSYTITHNGTGQILGASVDITLGSLSNQQASFVQTFTVKFVMVGSLELTVMDIFVWGIT